MNEDDDYLILHMPGELISTQPWTSDVEITDCEWICACGFKTGDLMRWADHRCLPDWWKK